MDPEEKTSCCGMTIDIVSLQDEAIQLLAKVVGIPVEKVSDKPEPSSGSLDVVETNLRAVERKMRLLCDLLYGLRDRV